MTFHRDIGLLIIAAVILSVVPLAGGRLVRFEHGYSYQYQYQANVTLDQVDTFQSAAKVSITNIDNREDASELMLEIDEFKFKLKHRTAAHDHMPAFTKWFSVVMSHNGEVKSILYDANEDGEILNVKEAITALLAGTYLDRDMARHQITDEPSWSYTTEGLGHEGKHRSMYKVVPNSNGKTFTKSRVLHKHIANHAESTLEKIIYIDDNLGTIHSVSVNESMTAIHTSKPGFDPYYAMRKVDAINEFEQIDYPNFKAYCVGKLQFLEKKTDRRIKVRPANVKFGYLHLPNEMNWKAPPTHEDDVRQYGAYIQSNLTCMRMHEQSSDFANRLVCFHNIVSIMRVMSVEEVTNLTQFFFDTSSVEIIHVVADQNAILDALGAMETDLSQNLLLKYILQRTPPDNDMVQRALTHVATMQGAPNQNILAFLKTALADAASFINKFSLTTYHRTLLTIGSVANKLTKDGNNTTVGELLNKLHSMVGIHDPWKYRQRRELMTEEEQLQYDKHHVILLEALGNGRHDDSYEYIVSHVNTTNSDWIKRAGIHALRKYYHAHAAEILLDLAQTDENEEVRYEAMLQYNSHPKAIKQHTMYSRRNQKSPSASHLSEPLAEEVANVSRHKRGIPNPKLDFKLEAPSVDWRKRVGSDAIGGSFGAIMFNFLHLQVSLLSGLFKVVVHNEVYARVHLGFLGFNFDFFSARICFKGGTSYDVNILQEFDPRLNQENLHLVTESLGNIVDGIRSGVNMLSSVIRGISEDFSLKTTVDEFLNAFRAIPNKILNLRSTAVKMARELGEFIVLELPPFVQPVKDLVEYASNLLNGVKSDFMDFYTSVVQVVETTIPNAAETLYKSANSIIENFPKVFKDPKRAVARIGKAVTRIAITIKQLNMTKEKIKESVNLKVLPYLTNVDSEFETLVDMTQTAYNAIEKKGSAWIDEVIDGEDPVDVVTGGKMTTADLRRRVVLKLQGIIDDMYEPFSNLRNLGQQYSEKFSRLFSLISDFKKAYNLLKTGYKQARAVIETIFGPKCHTEFPRLIRLSDMDCSGDGFFPSHLGRVYTEYEHRGIDIVIGSGNPVVSPFSGVIVLTNNNNEVKLIDMEEMIKDTEVIITNVKPLEDIQLQSDHYYTKKRVAAGDTIGTTISSPCSSSSNHIHFTVLKHGKPVDPTRFLQPRRPSPPKWQQICDDYKVVYKGETLDAGVIVGIGGRSQDDTSGHLPDDGENPTSLDASSEPSFNHDSSGMLDKLRQANKRKKRGVLDSAKNMIDVLVEHAEAFLEQFSISRITMGNIVSFINLLELENTKAKLAQTLKTIKNSLNNKPCKTPDAMTTEELQIELTVRGLTAAGGRRNMIDILTSADERCPYLALGIPEAGHLYCNFDSQCMGVQCCLNLRVADLLQLSYKAYAVLDVDEMSLTVGFENWKHTWNLELREEAIEDTVRPNIQFDLLELEVLCRFKIQFKERAIILTFGAGLCSIEDTDICLVYENVIEDAVFPLPTVLENATLVMPKVDWVEYFELETVQAKIEDIGQNLVSESTDMLVDRLISAINVPKELLQTNPRCLIPENLPDEDLRSALRNKGLSTNGSRTEQEQRLRIADRTCYPTDGQTFTFPEIENDNIKNYFYYFASKNCLRIDACLDVTVEELNITKTFSSSIELLPCSFQAVVRIEKWSKTVYLIDFDWGAVNKIKLNEAVYLSFTLDKSNETNELIMDAELVVDSFNININFLRSQSIPTPSCGGNVTLPGKGDLLSLAKILGGQLSEEAFEIFLSSIGIADIIKDQHCVLRKAPTDCKENVDEFIPSSLQSIIKCQLLENCWGLQCCIEFTQNIPLSSKYVPVSLPFMFRYNPCQYFAEFSVGKHSFKEWLFEYKWGVQESVTIGNKAPITISYDVKKFEEGFTIDVQLSICIPMGDDETLCIPNDSVMHLIENEHIPACLHELDYIKGIPNFSLTEWMQERGKMIGDEIGDAGKDFLIDKLKMKDFLLPHACDRKKHPFSPTVNGWNMACRKSLLNIPTLPDYVACHVDETCSRIVCCIDVEVIGLSLKFDLDIDLCGNSIIASFESAQQKVDNALSKYEWGREKNISIAKVLNLRYKIQKPGRNTYVVYAHMSICMERDGSCFLDTTFFHGIEIPRRICGSSYERCMVLVEEIEHQCAIDNDCLGVTCDVLPKEETDLPAVSVSYRMDSCTNDIIVQVDNKKWERSLSSVIMDETYSRSISEELKVLFALDESAIEFRVDLNLTTCGYYSTYNNCSVIEVLKAFPIKKANCTELKNRKKRDTTVPYKILHLKEGMKDLWTKKATNEEIDQFLQSIVNSNVQLRHANYEAVTLASSDVDTSLLSRLKALGHNNPMSIPFANFEFKAGFTVDIEGADALFQLLDDADNLYEHGEKTFLIGKGLTKKGVRQLADMIANMTIGDLEALLDLSNIDPAVTQQIINDLIDLATELYSETTDAMFSEKMSNAFESFDIVLRGNYIFPDVSATFFEYSYPFPMGPVVAELAFGAGCSYGINAGVSLKVMNMLAEPFVTPKGGLHVYGSLRICFGPLCAEIRLTGFIMTMSFPTKAEVAFSKFPLEVGLRMDLHLVPLRLVLAGIVTLRIKIPLCCSFTITLWKQNIWSYRTALIEKAGLISLSTKDKDPDPPEFTPLTDDETQVAAPRHCEVQQLSGYDYTEPVFQIATAASDSLSQVSFFLDVGTAPGGTDVIHQEKLGGAQTKVSKVLSATGVPVYFTLFAQNSQGSRSSVTCELPTYDITLPSGRFEAAFSTTSNPDVLQAYVVVHDDSPVVEAYVGIGYGAWIYGDQFKRFKPVSLEKRNASLGTYDDPHNLRTLEQFTNMKNGRLIGEIIKSEDRVHTAGDCARKCLDLPTFSCLSINYDYGTSGLCEILKSVEGHDFILAQDGLFSHYERLGTGHAVEFSETGLYLDHNFLYKFNLDMTNSLGYRHIITTKGILTDFSTPEPGIILHAKEDFLETIPCSDIIPDDRPDWQKYCIGVNTAIQNHRVVVDGEGSRTVFNGQEMMTDIQFTRISNYISANWDGFRDNETSIRGYTFAAGDEICQDLIHPHHDPHRHLLSEKHWENRGQIHPIPPPNTNLPDGQYFITVRALNKVMYGGPLSVTVCHTTPYIVDTSAPIVHEISSLRYDERSFFLYGAINISDPHSGIAEYDLCFGETSRTCDLLPWFKYNYIKASQKIEHRYPLPNGVPVWVRVRAVNNVLLSTVGVADHAIMLDGTGPFPGKVYDGPSFKTDLQFSKYIDTICVNWFDFYDPESGISKYMVGVGTKPGLTNIVRLTKQSGKQHSACLLLDEGNRLEHGKLYYGVVWAFNGAVVQRNISAVSDGVQIDLSPPQSGTVVDGRLSSLTDQQFSCSKSSLDLQWDGFSDPESGIKEFYVKITKQNGGDLQTLKDWTAFPNTEKYASWNNFHNKHKDHIKSSLRVRNGAMNDLTVETDGVLIDLTAPVVTYLYDGSDAGLDLDFQSEGTQVSCIFESYDHESGIESIKFQVYEKKNGHRRKIWPDVDDWDKYSGENIQTYHKTGLQLSTGALYTVRVGVSNNAGEMTIHETNGVKLDLSEPKIKWLHVGVFSGEKEDLHNGYVYQTDHSGIKISLLAVDPESGVSKINIRVGTSPGSDDVKKEMPISGTLQDLYITDINLHDTDTSSDVFQPVYYVTAIAYNGAGMQSVENVSNPIAVLPEDIPGIVYDGIQRSQEHDDADYDCDSSSASVSFFGFKSISHGISTFLWAVGTAPGLEDVQPFTEYGITSLEDNGNENAMDFTELAQMPLNLQYGETYFSTVRGITNDGNVLESASDGVLIDVTPGTIVFESTPDADEAITESPTPEYLSDVHQFERKWHYFDDQYKTQDVLDNIDVTWMSIGTYPIGENIRNLTEQPVTPTHVGHLSGSNIGIINTGSPYIVNVYAKNKAGYTSVKSASACTIDSSAPAGGMVACSDYIQPQGVLRCTWTHFFDDESPLTEYRFSLGTQEGYADLISRHVLPANITWFQTDASELPLLHDMTIYATVTAVNSVKLEAFEFSNKIMVDTSPPEPGVVVELSQEHVLQENRNSTESDFACQTAADCLALDTVCQESLVSIDVGWQAFHDEESGISNYQIAVGTTEGGVEILDFTTVHLSLTESYSYRVSGVSLYGTRQVYVKIKAINGAGLSTISVSNGVFISYVSQGLSPLLPIGVWDADPVIIGDINYQTDSSTIRAAWDVTGDPCPAVQFEWAIERLDGKIIQDFIAVQGEGLESNDQQNFQNGETYYSLLKVTNALGYQYVLRSDGVTIHSYPLAPGSVYDGDILGYDLPIIDSKSTVTCNWENFGVAVAETVESVLTGNVQDREIIAPDNQEVSYYEVGLGSDRRHSETKDDIAAFRNVGKRTYATFTGLDLIAGNAVYYCTVRAYSSERSTASVTSNGFSVSFQGGVTAMDIVMPRFITSDSEMSVQWVGFESKADMMLYYIAIADSDTAKPEDCKHYVDSPDAFEENDATFNVQNVKNVALNTHVVLENLILQHGKTYYVYVIGVDFSGECNMTMSVTTIDLTPPGGGHITAGPYYDMKLAYTTHTDKLYVKWKDYEDLESGIDTYELSIWRATSCNELNSAQQVGEPVRVSHTVRNYLFRDVELSANKPYIVKLQVINQAGLSGKDETSPVLFDDSMPLAGKVVEGIDYRNDVVFWGATDHVQGTFLHFPSPSGLACPSRSISFRNDPLWKFLEMHNFQQPDDRIWKLRYIPAHAKLPETTDYLEIKMSRDTKYNQMLSGGIVRPADLDEGGVYKLSVKAADGNGLAVTEMMFLEATLNDFQTFNYKEEPDWTDHLCSCCVDNPQGNDCPCSNCETYLENLQERVEEDTTTSQETTMIPFTSTTKREGSIDEDRQSGGFAKKETITKQNGCGLQIINGPTPLVIVWCRFFNDTNRDMKMMTELQFDPTDDFHSYKMVYSVSKEDLIETWELEVYIDDQKIQKFSGIPKFSNKANFFIHVWNRENYVPELVDVFDNWMVKAVFKDLVFPPKVGELCRYGEVFQSGTNPFIRYEAAIGSQKGLTDVQAFSEVISPCIPCSGPCSSLHCDPLCRIFTEQLTFKLENLNLPTTLNIDNETTIASYYLAVRAVLSSGASVVSYSDGFYIDTTPPTMNLKALMYIDVDQSDFTPVDFQGCNHTIKVIWLCEDEESEIQNYEWAIGSTIGGTDIQKFRSTGDNPTGINRKLEGVLQHRSRYYISVQCTNEAGLMLLFNDTKGVEVLLEAPDSDKVNGHTVGADSFETEVKPPNAQKSDDHEAVGVSWGVMDDPSVIEYDFCVGSSKYKLDDIFQCVWVGYNESGSVEIRGGYLMYAGQQMYSLKELGQKATNDSGPGKFKVETGRILFPAIHVCNQAKRCTWKPLETVTVTSKYSDIQTATAGSTLVFTVNQRRLKRDDTEEEDIIVETPSDLNTGQTVIVSILTEEELKEDYGSDASEEFVPYISNPNVSMHSTERLLSGRIQMFKVSFSIASVGQLSMTGPILVSFPQLQEDPNSEDELIAMLIHWNPDYKEWQISSRTCTSETGTVIDNPDTQRTIVKICDTRAASASSYFYAETQFAIVSAKAFPVNNAPELQPVPALKMLEDEGTLILQLLAYDIDGDDVDFILLSSVNNFPNVASEMKLDKNGSFTFTPCQTCYGTLKDIKIELVDIPDAQEIEPLHSYYSISIEVEPVNDAPVIFLLNDEGDLLLHPDPTEESKIFLENRDGRQEKFSGLIGAYDIDANEELTISTRIAANGTVNLTQIDPAERDTFFDCNATWCLDTVPATDPHKMTWVLAHVSYVQGTAYTGIDSIQMVVQDSLGTYSDPVTLKLVIMEMPCLHGGECIATGERTCSDEQRVSDFFDNYACACPLGWSGRLCDKDVNECEHSPCGVPYACNNLTGSYECYLSEIAVILIVISLGLLAAVVCLFLCRHKIKSFIKHRKKVSRRTENVREIYVAPEIAEGFEMTPVDLQANARGVSYIAEDTDRFTERGGKRPVDFHRSPHTDLVLIKCRQPFRNIFMKLYIKGYGVETAREKQSKAQSVSPANIHYVINKDKEIDIPTYMNTSQLKDQLKYPKTRPLYVDSDDDDVSIFDFTAQENQTMAKPDSQANTCDVIDTHKDNQRFKYTHDSQLGDCNLSKPRLLYFKSDEDETSMLDFTPYNDWNDAVDRKESISRPSSVMSATSTVSDVIVPPNNDCDHDIARKNTKPRSFFAMSDTSEVSDVILPPDRKWLVNGKGEEPYARPYSAMSVTSAVSEVILPNAVLPVNEDDSEQTQEDIV